MWGLILLAGAAIYAAFWRRDRLGRVVEPEARPAD
jgi:hypothetical protein